MDKIYDVTLEQYNYIRKRLAGIVFFWKDDEGCQVKTGSSKWQEKIDNYLNDGTEIIPWA